MKKLRVYITLLTAAMLLLSSVCALAVPMEMDVIQIRDINATLNGQTVFSRPDTTYQLATSEAEDGSRNRLVFSVINGADDNSAAKASAIVDMIGEYLAFHVTGMENTYQFTADTALTAITDLADAVLYSALGITTEDLANWQLPTTLLSVFAGGLTTSVTYGEPVQKEINLPDGAVTADVYPVEVDMTQLVKTALAVTETDALARQLLDSMGVGSLMDVANTIEFYGGSGEYAEIGDAMTDIYMNLDVQFIANGEDLINGNCIFYTDGDYAMVKLTYPELNEIIYFENNPETNTVHYGMMSTDPSADYIDNIDVCITMDGMYDDYGEIKGEVTDGSGNTIDENGWIVYGGGNAIANFYFSIDEDENVSIKAEELGLMSFSLDFKIVDDETADVILSYDEEGIDFDLTCVMKAFEMDGDTDDLEYDPNATEITDLLNIDEDIMSDINNGLTQLLESMK